MRLLRPLANRFLLAAGLLLAVGTAIATPIAWYFEGEFSTFSTEYADAGLSIGDKLYGGIVFSSSAPDVLPADTVTGAYDAAFSFVYVPSLNSYWTFFGPDNAERIVIQNDAPQETPYDFFEVFMRNTSLDTVLPNPTRQFFFNGRAGTDLFSSDALPTGPPDVSAFEFLHFQYTDLVIAPFSSATGTISRIYRVAEPSGLALICIGLGGIAVSRRRRLML